VPATSTATRSGGRRQRHLVDLEGVDTLDGGPGNDELYSGSGSVSRGGAGDDRIGSGRLRDGDAGNDVLDIGASLGGLTGGSGADVFMAAALGRVSGRITDFNPSEGDVIDLSLFDASEVQAGNHRWSYIGTAPFSAAGQVRHEMRGDTTIVQASWDGVAGPGPALELELAGRPRLTERSFGLGFASGDGAETITGTGLAEHIDGLDGNDTILGRGGADRLYGGDGRNLIRGSDGDDWIVGGFEDDRIHGDAGDDSVQGGNGEDRIEASAGDDDLYGGDVANTLAGGAGNDVFSFLSGDIVGFGQRDVILDFGAGDLINVGGHLENARWFRNEPTYELIGTAALAGPSQVRYQVAGERTIVQVSAPYEATLSYEVELAGRHSLTEADFILSPAGCRQPIVARVGNRGLEARGDEAGGEGNSRGPLRHPTPRPADLGLGLHSRGSPVDRAPAPPLPLRPALCAHCVPRVLLRGCPGGSPLRLPGSQNAFLLVWQHSHSA
jgi:hypothetical protein